MFLMLCLLFLCAGLTGSTREEEIFGNFWLVIFLTFVISLSRIDWLHQGSREIFVDFWLVDFWLLVFLCAGSTREEEEIFGDIRKYMEVFDLFCFWCLLFFCRAGLTGSTREAGSCLGRSLRIRSTSWWIPQAPWHPAYSLSKTNSSY